MSAGGPITSFAAKDNSSNNAAEIGRRSDLHNFFQPLNLEATRKTSNNSSTKKEIPIKSPRSRSIKFADEKEEAQFMLETILLFETDDDFCDSSVVEAVMEDFYDSCSSFDSWEYAHSGNCPLTKGMDMDNSNHSAESKDNDDGDEPQLTLQELEQQVREEHARAFQEKRNSVAVVAQAVVEEDEKNASTTIEVPIDIILGGSPEDDQEEKDISNKETKKEPISPPTPLSPLSQLSPKQGRRQARQGTLRRAMQKSPSLRMLEETAKARRIREHERKKEDKEIEEKKVQELNERDKKFTGGNEIARRRASFEPNLKALKLFEEQKDTKKEQPQKKEDVKIAKKPPQQQQQEEQNVNNQQQEGVKRIPRPARQRPKRTKSSFSRLKRSNTDSELPSRRVPTTPLSAAVEAANKASPKVPLRRNITAPELTSRMLKSKAENANDTSPSTKDANNKNQEPGVLKPAVATTATGLENKPAEPLTNGQSVQKNRQNELKAIPKFAPRNGGTQQTSSAAADNARSAQQKRQDELKGIGSSRNKSVSDIRSTAAENARSTQQRRLDELNAVKEQSIVGANVLNKRERLVVKLQAAARSFLVRTHVVQHQRHAAATIIQALARGCRVRKCLAGTYAKVAALERQLQSIERSKEDDLSGIMESPELQLLQDQLQDSNLNARQRAVAKEKSVIRKDMSSLKDNISQIKIYMENLKINNKNLAKSTREVEWQSSQMMQRNVSLEKTSQYLMSKYTEVQAKVTTMVDEIADLECKANIEQAVGKISHQTILQIRELTKIAAQDSDDPFLKKVKSRAKILDRLSGGKKKTDSWGGPEVCPVVASR